MSAEKFLIIKKTDVGKLCALLSDLPYFNTATDVTDIDAAWTHGSSITINLLVNASHKLMPGNLMRLRGSTPKLDICHLKKIMCGK